MSEKKELEAIYPISPMQEGMLFYTLYEPESALYVEQLTFQIEGEVQEPLLRQAWQAVLDHHPILRTAFVWKKQEAPLQVVFKQAALPWQSLDWQHLVPDAQAEALDALLHEERGRGFDLATPPLCQATLIRLAPARYRFVWSNHHLLLDGWSLPIVLQQVFGAYAALVAGETVALPPSRPYRDFITWLGQQPPEADQPFWEQALDGFDAPVSLVDSVGGTPVSTSQQSDPRAYTVALSPEQTARLSHLTRQERLTLGTLIYGAWALLLQRYSSKRDVLFGVTVAGRPHELAGAEQMVGLFINTLPLRVQVSPDTPLADWLATLQAEQVALRQHEHTPLRRIQEWSGIPAGSALFDSLVVVENYPVQTEQLNRGQLPIALSDFRAEERPNYALTIVARLAEKLEITLLYDGSALRQAQVEQIGGHLTTLLSHLPDHLAQPIHSLPILTEAERARLLHEWNDTAVTYPYDDCIHRLIEQMVVRQPEALALKQGELTYSYQELERRANQLARTLQARGIGPDSLVALCVESTPDLMIGALAIWKAGGGYIALDPTLPRERLAFMMSDARASVILTHSRWQAQLPTSDIPTLFLDDEAAFDPDGAPVTSSVALDNLAYIIFTSGSTGLPKGVAISHRSLLNLVGWHLANFKLTPASRATQVANPAFDASVMDIGPTLVAGASLHFAPTADAATPPGLLQWMKDDALTHSFVVTPIAETAFQQHVWPPDMALEFLITGGDRLRPAKPAWFKGEFINVYGPTEDTVITTTYSVQDQPLPPIGRPLANKQLFLLDERLNPVPVGVAGELYIGGIGLARGYINRPAQTAERFIPNPFLKEHLAALAAQTGESEEALLAGLPAHAFRLYRTGDIARYLPDGTLISLGRQDGQVKISGYRIELGEIETTLTQHPAVKQALVTVWQNRVGAKQLLAYITSSSKVPPSLRDLERFLKQRLPSYMIPKSFFVLKEFPYVATGSKIDRKALPVPEEYNERSSEIVAPRSEIETQLVALWQQVLKIERLGVQHNFFELGGDSILCIQLVSRARQAGLHFGVKQLFQYPTIAELAPHVSLHAPVVAEQGEVVGEVPLTPVQHWFFAQPLPTPQHYNQPFLFVERQPMEPRWAEQALNHLVQHHDTLRSHYERTPDGWVQRIAPVGQPVAFSLLDLSATPDDRIAAAIEAACQEAQRSLDLTTGPLVRCLWFDLGEGRPNRFLWLIHHLVVDGFSWRTLLDDFQNAYQQCRRGQAPRLPAKTSAFKQWAERLRYAVQHEALFADEAAHWLTPLAGATGRCPVDAPENIADNLEGTTATVDVALTAPETQRLLQELPAALNTTINDILLTALGLTLTEWMGSPSLLVDLEGHGRAELFAELDLSRTVGWFTSIYPIRLDFPAGQSLGDAIKGVKGTLQQVPQQGVGFQALRSLSPDAETRARFATLPTAEVRFNYMGQYDQSFDDSVPFMPAEESSGPAISPDAPRTHLLDIAGGVLREQFRLTWMYSSRLHHRETVDRLAARYLDHLRQILAFSDSAQATPLMTPADFPGANLNQQQLDQFLSAIGGGDG